MRTNDKRQTPQHTAITQHGTIAIIVLIAIVLMHHNNSHLGVLPARLLCRKACPPICPFPRSISCDGWGCKDREKRREAARRRIEGVKVGGAQYQRERRANIKEAEAEKKGVKQQGNELNDLMLFVLVGAIRFIMKTKGGGKRRMNC